MTKEKVKKTYTRYIRALIVSLLVGCVAYVCFCMYVDPMQNYMCPDDWGEGSANWACQEELSKIAPHAFFVTRMVPSIICAMIAFLIALPKNIEFYWFIFIDVLYLILAICFYYLVTDYDLIYNTIYLL